jgi:hypothetical protein
VIVLPDGFAGKPTKKFEKAQINKPIIISKSKLRELLCFQDEENKEH